MRNFCGIVLSLFLFLGCSQNPEVFSSQELDSTQLSVYELMEYYEESAAPGHPRVVEGFITEKKTEEGTIYLVDTWESDHETAMELIVTEEFDMDELKVYCIVVDHTTTCDFSDDLLVYYWLVK